jgi:hypothetical protein
MKPRVIVHRLRLIRLLIFGYSKDFAAVGGQNRCLFMSKKPKDGVPLRLISRFSQDLAVVDKILFVNVTLHWQTPKFEARVLPNSQSPKAPNAWAVILPTCAQAARTL